jgi:TonB family protein
MRIASLFAFLCILHFHAFAQKIPIDQHKYFVYLGKDRGQLPTKEGATYVRVFMGIDSVKTIYEVRDYTLSGTLVSISESSSKDMLMSEGLTVWYNKERKIIRKGYFAKGYPSGEWTEYYGNGQLKATFNMLPMSEMAKNKFNIPYSVINSWDSLGHAEVVKGNGQYLQRDDTSNAVIEKGIVKNGLRDGSWEGYGRSGEIAYTETYTNGAFIKGTRYDDKGSRTEYTELQIPPTFPGGEAALMKFLRKNIQYPPDASFNKESGTVYVLFVVDTLGGVTNVTIGRGVTRSLDKEASRVVKMMPLWKPGMIRGRKEAIPFTLPVRFAL